MAQPENKSHVNLVGQKYPKLSENYCLISTKCDLKKTL